jgi:hypothetical protein
MRLRALLTSRIFPLSQLAVSKQVMGERANTGICKICDVHDNTIDCLGDPDKDNMNPVAAFFTGKSESGEYADLSKRVVLDFKKAFASDKIDNIVAVCTEVRSRCIFSNLF